MSDRMAQQLSSSPVKKNECMRLNGLSTIGHVRLIEWLSCSPGQEKERKGTLFKCLVILTLKHYWGHCQMKLTINTNQIKCWFSRRGENRSTYRKASHCRVESQQTQPTYDTESSNRTQPTVGVSALTTMPS